MRISVLLGMLLICTSAFAQEQRPTLEEVTQRINETNAKIKERNLQWSAGITSTSFLTNEEKIKLYGALGGPVPEDYTYKKYHYPQTIRKIAEIPDWQSLMSPVEDQNDPIFLEHGTCYAHAATGVIEGLLHHLLGSNIGIDLEEMDIAYSVPGDIGGYSWEAFDYVENSKIASENLDSYPNFPGVYWGINSYYCETDLGVQGVQYLLNFSPIYAKFAIFPDWDLYNGHGIYATTGGDTLSYHAVVIVGYDNDNQCWICKNSWGSGWGDDGYFRIAYGNCGIDSLEIAWAEIDSTCYAKICPGVASNLHDIITAPWVDDGRGLEKAYLNADYTTTGNDYISLPEDRDLICYGDFTIADGLGFFEVCGDVFMDEGKSINIDGTLYLSTSGRLKKFEGGNNWGYLNIRDGGTLYANSGFTLQECSALRLYEATTLTGNIYLGTGVNIETYDALTLHGCTLSKNIYEQNWGYLDIKNGGSLTVSNSPTIRDCSALRLYDATTISGTLSLGPGVDVKVYDTLTLENGAALQKKSGETIWGNLDIMAGGTLITNETAYTISDYTGITVSGTANLQQDFSLPAGKSLTVSGTLKMGSGKNINISGGLTLNGTIQKISTNWGSFNIYNGNGLTLGASPTIRDCTAICVHDPTTISNTLNLGPGVDLQVYDSLTLNGSTLQKISGQSIWHYLDIMEGGSLTIANSPTIKDCAAVRLYEATTISGTLNLGSPVSIAVYDTLTLNGATLQKAAGGANWGGIDILAQGNYVGQLAITNSPTIRDCSSVDFRTEHDLHGTLYLGPDVDLMVYDSFTLNSDLSLLQIQGQEKWGVLYAMSGSSLSIGNGATLKECWGLETVSPVTLGGTMYLGPGVDIGVSNTFTMNNGGKLTKVAGQDSIWGYLMVYTGGTLTMNSGSTIEYGEGIESYGYLSFPSSTPSCHIQYCTKGVTVHQYATTIRYVHFIDNEDFALKTWSPNLVVGSHHCTIEGENTVNAAIVDGYGRLVVYSCILENTGGDNIVMNGDYSRLYIDFGEIDFYPNGNLALCNRDGFHIPADSNYWGDENPDMENLFAYPNYVYACTFMDTPYGFGADKPAEDPRREFAEIMKRYGSGDWEGTLEDFYRVIEESDDPEMKNMSISALLQMVLEHDLDGSRIRGMIEKEMPTASPEFAAELDYLWCDSFMFEGKYEQADRVFAEHAVKYKGALMEASMLSKRAIISAQCFNDSEKALEFAQAAAVIAPGAPSTKSAFLAAGIKSHARDANSDLEESDLPEPLPPQPLEPEAPENFITMSPNPFNPATTFHYGLIAPSRVRLSIYSITGQKIATVLDEWADAGAHSVRFDGSGLSSGMYFYRFESPGFADTGKMLLVK